MGWFTPTCPVRPQEQEWIDTSTAWLREQFGPDIRDRPVVLPTTEFFPEPFDTTREDVDTVFAQVCGHLHLDPGDLDVEYVTDIDPTAHPLTTSSHSGAAAHYHRRDGRGVVTIRLTPNLKLVPLIATIAHELCHELLIGHAGVAPDRPDGEPLTDLATVFFGLGLFTANARHNYTVEAASTTNRYYRYSVSQLGYLTEPMYGYAHAVHAHARGESKPDWARHLDTNPRHFLKKGLRYLAATDTR